MPPIDEKRPLKVFLCHSSADKAKVREVYKFLQQQGFQPWLDEESILPGQNWNLEISKALDDSDAIIIFLSKGSVSKEGYVQKEIKFALDRALEMPEGRIFIIPARLEDCDLPRGLKQYQAVNLYVEGGAEKLLKALKVRVEQLQDVEASTSSERAASKFVLPRDNSNINSKSPKMTPGRRKLDTAIVVALISLFGTICAAVINLGGPIVEKSLIPAPLSSATISIISSTPTTSPWPTPTSYSGPLPIEITDNFGAKMNLVPAGNFVMGRDNGEYNEMPLHQVNVEAFYIDRYEVSTAQYKVCVDNGVCNPPSSTEFFYRGSSYYGNPDFANYPVVYVDWHQARNFCEWRGARLPTEIQWEKAARGADGRSYPWGEQIDCSYLNYASCLGETYKIGSYEKGKSPYGIYDMAGNVWEWVNTWYDAYPGNLVPDLDYGIKYRVVRGGSYFDIDAARSSHRYYYAPDASSIGIGFRCAKDVP